MSPKKKYVSCGDQHITPDRTTHSVEPTDISPLASNTVNSPVHATTSSVEPTDTSPIAYDARSKWPIQCDAETTNTPAVRAPTISSTVPGDSFTSAAASGNDHVAMDMCFPMSAPTLIRMTIRVGHAYTGQGIMVCRSITAVSDRQSHRCTSRQQRHGNDPGGEDEPRLCCLQLDVAQQLSAKKTTPRLLPDTMSATDAEGNTPLLCSAIHHH